VYLFNTHVHASPPYDRAFLDRLDGLFREGKLTEEGLTRAKASIADGQKWRADEIVGLLAFIAQKTPSGAPVILMGDFNAEAYTPEMQPVFERGFIDTFWTKNPDDPGHTWNPAANLNSVYYERPRGEQTPETIAGGLDDLVSKRIDFIFAAGPFREGDVVESRVVFDRAVNGRHPSDHFGLMSVIRIP
jgi:endonuclease/exonuclease/phosphatase family metal-dependent hydrolase